MYIPIPVQIKQHSGEGLFSTPAFKYCRTIWQQKLHDVLGNNYNESPIKNPGDYLSDIYRS